ncbi:MAG: GNAT family N-acetyltransferase [Candidatus Bathyarchaeota archaeon]|nr:GNAT family N-acetyltransferase [Candidatus Bathyarchaeota archaeon]
MITDFSSENKGTVTLCAYTPEHKNQWNTFVSTSKNGVFLFYREYMDYHSNRFQDHSLMFFNEDQLVALLPANVYKETLYSHGGLTFGGVISGFNMKTPLMLNIFEALLNHCRNQSIKEVVYKTIPYIYHLVPSDEDLYALFTCKARLEIRNVSSCILLPKASEFAYSRKRNIQKAQKNGIVVRQSSDFGSFMKILADSLQTRHNVKPVHTLEEIKLLASRFPENIKLFASFQDSAMLAGIVVYESKNVTHIQYAANSPKGRDIGAQDIIEDYLIREQYKNKKYFDFGISTEKMGHFLNLGLIRRKENFSASAIMYDTYQIIV